MPLIGLNSSKCTPPILLLIYRLILFSTVLHISNAVPREVKPDVLVPEPSSDRNDPSDGSSASDGNGPRSFSDQETPTANGDKGEDEDEDITDLDGKGILHHSDAIAKGEENEVFIYMHQSGGGGGGCSNVEHCIATCPWSQLLDPHCIKLHYITLHY